jgi:hypothetical protein
MSLTQLRCTLARLYSYVCVPWWLAGSTAVLGAWLGLASADRHWIAAFFPRWPSITYLFHLFHLFISPKSPEHHNLKASEHPTLRLPAIPHTGSAL